MDAGDSTENKADLGSLQEADRRFHQDALRRSLWSGGRATTS